MQREALGFIKSNCLLNKPMNSLEDYHELMKNPDLLLSHPSYANVRYETIVKIVLGLMQKKNKKNGKKFAVVATTGELVSVMASLDVDVFIPETARGKIDCYICGPGTFPLVKATKYIVVGCFNDYSFSDLLMHLRYGQSARSVTRDDWKINFEDKYDTIISTDSVCDTIRLAVDRLVVPDIIQNSLIYLKEKLIRAGVSSGVRRADCIIETNRHLGSLLQIWSKNPTVDNWLTIITNV